MGEIIHEIGSYIVSFFSLLAKLLQVAGLGLLIAGIAFTVRGFREDNDKQKTFGIIMIVVGSIPSILMIIKIVMKWFS